MQIKSLFLYLGGGIGSSISYFHFSSVKEGINHILLKSVIVGLGVIILGTYLAGQQKETRDSNQHFRNVHIVWNIISGVIVVLSLSMQNEISSYFIASWMLVLMVYSVKNSVKDGDRKIAWIIVFSL